MLGHTLRGVEDSPAYLSILFAVNAETDLLILKEGVVDPVSIYLT